MYQNLIEEYIDNLRQDKELQGNSSKWANWMSKLLPNTCKFCVDQHGKIVDVSVLNNKGKVSAHRNCQCVYVAMRTKLVGFVTDLGLDGVDVYLADYGRLPDYYINKRSARRQGWIDNEGNLDKVLPGRVIGGDEFYNSAGKLPSDPGRKWYEVDINYDGGFRNNSRILFSSDGLFFVTYDHYHTFYEITE